MVRLGQGFRPILVVPVALVVLGDLDSHCVPDIRVDQAILALRLVLAVLVVLVGMVCTPEAQFLHKGVVVFLEIPGHLVRLDVLVFLVFRVGH